MRRVILFVILMLAMIATVGTVAAEPSSTNNFGSLLSGAEEVPARATLGNAEFSEIEPAPGRYVTARTN